MAQRKRRTTRVSTASKDRTNNSTSKRTRKKDPKELVCLKSGRTWQVKSIFEKTVGESLNERGFEFEYEPVKIRYKHSIRGAKCSECSSNVVYKLRTYTPDWSITGYTFYIETKGKLSVEERQKFESLKNSQPDLDVRFVFMKDNWLTKAHKKRYSEWASDNNFRWSIGDIPDEWFSRESK
jgi:DNA-directed RNA polymerase subunit RPC12/RpoP